ncbi:GGDEF domain-containing protein [Cyanothece sp. BG0011]|uniref:GGDEF domain-containing protein n=1 Tax=Cyanothece sp. BG0011 TaxID=2082950 RepID=UPI000D1EF9A8|nr:GGDEF domain-containing protein [Cyanothece sp. BG0011]
MKNNLKKITQILDSLPPSLIIGLGLLLVAVITALDYSIKIDLGISIFYLFPIALITWYSNKKIGLIFSFISSLCWFWAENNISKNPQLWLEEWNAVVRLSFFIIVTYLLSELKAAYEREKTLARTDGLTGAVNRRFFREILGQEIEKLSRYHHPFTLAYFDVDNFKKVNDQWGHSQGDYLLNAIVDIVKINIRQTDTLARLGGDEFALILLEIDYEKANLVLNRIQAELLIMAELEKMPISFSIGAITYYTIPDSIDHAIEQVDHLMYYVKNNGKNGLKHKLNNQIKIRQ